MNIIPKSPGKLSQTISLYAEDIARYSTSVDDFDTVGCFLHFHAMRVIKKIYQPVVERRVPGNLLNLNQQMLSIEEMSKIELQAFKFNSTQVSNGSMNSGHMQLSRR